jgi:hypothetical protein
MHTWAPFSGCDIEFRGSPQDVHRFVAQQEEFLLPIEGKSQWNRRCRGCAQWVCLRRSQVQTRIPMGKGTVLHGFGKLKPVPVPRQTRDTLSQVYPYLCHALAR